MTGDVELLGGDRLDAGLVRQLDHRTLLGTEHALAHAASEELVETGHRLHHLHAVGLVLQTFVDLQNGHDLLDVPQVVGRATTFDVAVHGHLEEDGGEHPVAVEARAGDDARTHLVDPVVHLGLVAVGILTEAVQLQCLRCASTALVERGDESFAVAHLVEHGLVVPVHGPIFADAT